MRAWLQIVVCKAALPLLSAVGLAVDAATPGSTLPGLGGVVGSSVGLASDAATGDTVGALVGCSSLAVITYTMSVTYGCSTLRSAVELLTIFLTASTTNVSASVFVDGPTTVMRPRNVKQSPFATEALQGTVCMRKKKQLSSVSVFLAYRQFSTTQKKN